MVAEARQRNRLRKLLDDYLRFGGFPETSTVDAQATKNEILVMYARNILYQDIAPRFSIKKAVDLENLFFYLASNIASLYSFNKLAALVGLNDKTVKEYLGYFSDAYLLFTLDSFAYSVKEQIKSPKRSMLLTQGWRVPWDSASARILDICWRTCLSGTKTPRPQTILLQDR